MAGARKSKGLLPAWSLFIGMLLALTAYVVIDSILSGPSAGLICMYPRHWDTWACRSRGSDPDFDRAISDCYRIGRMDDGCVKARHVGE